MTDPQVAILMLCLFIVLVLLGFPIAFTLLAMGVAFGYYAYYTGAPESIADIFNNNIFYLLNQNTYSVMENDTLVAIPLFLFMGYVVERANIVNRLFRALQLAAMSAGVLIWRAILLPFAFFHQNGQGASWVEHALFGHPAFDVYGPGYREVFSGLVSLSPESPDLALFRAQALLGALVPGLGWVIARRAGARPPLRGSGRWRA